MAQINLSTMDAVQYQTIQSINTQPKQDLPLQNKSDMASIGVVPESKIDSATPVKGREDAVTQSSQMEQSLITLNEQLNQLKNTLSFEQDQDSERMLIVVKDRDSGEVIRQIPSEEFMAISKNISQFLESVSQLDKKVSFPPGTLTSEKV
jgi:flagellar protein FlaG